MTAEINETKNETPLMDRELKAVLFGSAAAAITLYVWDYCVNCLISGTFLLPNWPQTAAVLTIFLVMFVSFMVPGYIIISIFSRFGIRHKSAFVVAGALCAITIFVYLAGHRIHDVTAPFLMAPLVAGGVAGYVANKIII